MAEIKLKLDVLEGTMDLECDGEDFEAVMTHADKLLAKFTGVRPKISAAVSSEPRPKAAEITSVETEVAETKPQETPKTKRKRGVGKPANWKIVPDLLNDDQRIQIKEFYVAKAPGKQNDQVAVLVHKLKEMLGRETFDCNDIYTAFQAMGAKTPKDLEQVLRNMSSFGLGKFADKLWTPHFTSDDLVNHDLPVAPKAS